MTMVKKLCEVMKAVGYIQKTGHNTQHGYKYVQEADIVEKIRGELATRNLFLMNSVENVSFRTIKTTKGGEVTVATLTIKYTLIDGDTGERLEFMGVGEGMDGGDKAVYKAQTGALKYALMKTFLIPTGDDPEKDQTEEATKEKEAAKEKTMAEEKQENQAAADAAPSKPGAASSEPGRGKVTIKQRKAIFAAGREKGLDEEQIRKLIWIKTKKESTKELTKKEASDIIDLLKQNTKAQLLTLIEPEKVNKVVPFSQSIYAAAWEQIAQER